MDFQLGTENAVMQSLRSISCWPIVFLTRPESRSLLAAIPAIEQ